ncbi:uncharacterized protein LOC123704730 [Colias croceus]|uniref:uncharacterized protein LOC123704730 n=1 Tax=Colias crocea TaxID=72248 RepID=UPI001E27D2B1|nr:uncharacterized protein LOC123704730 [Colias croceus]
MERKSRKPRTIQMRYPAPYSWSFDEAYDRRSMKTKKAVPPLENNEKNKWVKAHPTSGCDPYAPHLKYGIFRQKSSNKDNLSKINLHRSVSDHHRKKENRKAVKKGPSEQPYFTIRPLHCKNLSVSQVLHVDIKPRSRVVSPIHNIYRFNKHI